MIKIKVQTDGKEVEDTFEEENTTFKECALVLFRLKEIEKYLLEKEFENKFEVREGDFAEDEN